MKSTEETALSFSTSVPPVLCIQVVTALMGSHGNEATCLKILTNAIKRCSSTELTSSVVSGFVPAVLQVPLGVAFSVFDDRFY